MEYPKIRELLPEVLDDILRIRPSITGAHTGHICLVPNQIRLLLSKVRLCSWISLYRPLQPLGGCDIYKLEQNLRDLLVEHLGKIIGNGSITKVWGESWISTGSPLLSFGHTEHYWGAHRTHMFGTQPDQAPTQQSQAMQLDITL
ncbi:hypothetical protein F2Q69_00020241 [Brassica cretica]|uniref:Uncharacterized protein n=1 Tax=Brassica cretica TaxID=69181 RepID=A0A8S9Q1M1_BRACR|nr:hypothetical protein F2Q69_00020241 [Brassica cretica]